MPEIGTEHDVGEMEASSTTPMSYGEGLPTKVLAQAEDVANYVVKLASTEVADVVANLHSLESSVDLSFRTDNHSIEYYAQPPKYVFRRRALFQSRLSGWPRMGKALITLLVIAVLNQLFTFLFARRPSIRWTTDEGYEAMIERPYVPWPLKLLKGLLNNGLAILLLHEFNLDMFLRSISSFDGIVIFFSYVTSQIAWSYDFFYACSQSADCKTQWQVAEIIDLVLVFPPLIVFAAFDAWVRHGRKKIAVVTLAFCSALSDYVVCRTALFSDNQWLERKLDRQVCLWKSCADTKLIYENGRFRSCVFLAKQLFHLLHGRDIVFTRPFLSHLRSHAPSDEDVHSPRSIPKQCQSSAAVESHSSRHRENQSHPDITTQDASASCEIHHLKCQLDKAMQDNLMLASEMEALRRDKDKFEEELVELRQHVDSNIRRSEEKCTLRNTELLKSSKLAHQFGKEIPYHGDRNMPQLPSRHRDYDLAGSHDRAANFREERRTVENKSVADAIHMQSELVDAVVAETQYSATTLMASTSTAKGSTLRSSEAKLEQVDSRLLLDRGLLNTLKQCEHRESELLSELSIARLSEHQKYDRMHQSETECAVLKERLHAQSKTIKHMSHEKWADVKATLLKEQENANLRRLVSDLQQRISHVESNNLYTSGAENPRYVPKRTVVHEL